MIDRLVHFAGQYNQPSIQLNRFCRVCFHAYNSECCPDHLAHHGHHVAAVAENAGAGAVMEIHNIDGWAAVDGALLPVDFVLEVQVRFSYSVEYFSGCSFA